MITVSDTTLEAECFGGLIKPRSMITVSNTTLEAECFGGTYKAKVHDNSK